MSAYAGVKGNCDKWHERDVCSYGNNAKSIQREYCEWACTCHDGGVCRINHTDGVTCEYCARTYINSIEITSVDAPKAGFSLDTTARCGTNGVSDDSPIITWKADSAETSGTAKANTAYTAEIKLENWTGGFYKPSLSAKVNGNTATKVEYSSQSESDVYHVITVSYEFEATGAVTPIFDNCMGTKSTTNPSYTKGNKYTVHDSVKYTFGGWFTEPNGNGDEKTGVYEDGKIYYAKWINDYGKTVVTTTVNSKTSLPNGSGITWEQNKLTLNNATIDTVEPKAIFNDGEFTVEVVGTNTVASRYTGEVPDDNSGGSNPDPNKIAGIYCKGNLTIKGSGTLNISSGGFEDIRNITSYSDAIWAKGLTIDGVTLNAESGNADTGTGYNCGYTMAIYSKTTMNISNAKVTAKAGKGGSDVHNGFSMGINSMNSITISDSTVTAVSGNGAQDSAGIFAGPGYSYTWPNHPTAYGKDDKYLADITISNSTVKATSGKATNYTSNGIYAHNNITIEDSTVTATNGQGEPSNATSAAIFRNQDLKIDNSKVKAEGYGGGIDTYSYEDETDQEKDVVYGRTYIAGNSDVVARSLDDSPALLACNTLSVDNCSLTCTALKAGDTALLFDDPNKTADKIEGLVIKESGKIITNGIVKVGVTDSENPYYFGNTTDKNYYVTGSKTTRLNGTTNVVTPTSGQTMVISLKPFDQTDSTTDDSGAKVSGTKTGDTNNLMLYFGIFDLVMIAVVAMLYARVRNQKK